MSTTSPARRRPQRGGYARGEETRARILSAAMTVFGRVGFAQATTRQIAAEAGVFPPALQYYFDSKEGLHRACADLIIEHVQASLGPKVQAAEAAVRSGSPGDAIDALCDLFDDMIDVSLPTAEEPAWRQFIGSVQRDHAGPAFDLVLTQVAQPVHALCASLVAAATGQAVDAPETQARAVLLRSQLTAIDPREGTLKFIGWDDFSPDRATLIKALIRQHVVAALGGGAPSQAS